jgi:hypothetical protein
MRILACAVAAAVSLLPSVASAADDFIKGLYLPSEELCAKAKKDSLDSVLEAGNSFLTSNGIEGIEYHCEFVQVTKANASPAWLVGAVCQEPDYVFPDVLTIVQKSPTQLDLVSVTPVDPKSGGGNGRSYFLCDGVSPP